MLIVGAGPCGAALAVALARGGLAVTLLDSSRHIQRSFRGDALMPSGLEALERLGLLPLPGDVPRRALGGWRLAVEGRTLFRLAEPLDGPEGPPCTLVSQAAWLEQLLAPARRPAGLTLRLGEAASQLLQDDSGRITGVALADGSPLAADLVVGCDGRQSLVRRQAEIPLAIAAQPIDVLWFRFAAQAGPLPDDGFITLVGPAGLASLFTGADGQVQLGWGIPVQTPTPRLADTAWMERLAAQAPADLAAWLRQRAGFLQEPVRFSVQVGLAERWWRPGLLLLGDAAHPMSPVRAQGINMALRDAAVAAAALLSRPDRWPEPLELDGTLAGIEAARRPEVEALQRLQAAELQRGERLLQLPALRQLLARAAPWLGSAVGEYWRRQQRHLRQGLAPLPARR